MTEASSRQPQYQESKIEEEPILGPVLTFADGRVQPLTFMERLLVRLRLLNAKQLEARYLRVAAG